MKRNKYKLFGQTEKLHCRQSAARCTCIIIALVFLAACSHKSRVADFQSAKMAAMEAQQQAEWNKKKRMGNLSPEKLILAGKSYLAHGNHQLAKLHFAMAVKKNPKMAPAYIGLGEALVREGQLLQARAAYEQALAINEADKNTLLALGKICRKQNNYVEARQYLDTAKNLFPADPEILTELAITLDTMARETEAEPLYLKVTQLRPYQASAYNNLGFNLLLQEKYSEAVHSFYHALKLERGNKRIRNNLAVAYLLNGEEQKAVSLLKGTVGEAGAYNNVGYIYMVHGECDKAKKAFERALDLNPHYYTRASENLELLRRSCYLPGAVSVGHKLLDDDEMSMPSKQTEFTESAIAPEAGVDVIYGKDHPQAAQPSLRERFGNMKIVKVYSGHLREGPSLEAKVVGYLKKGEKVIERQQKEEWYFVKLADDRLGWAHKTLFWENADDSPPEHVLRGNPEILSATKKQKLPDSLSADNKMIPGAAAEDRLKSNHREQAIKAAPGPESITRSGESTAKSEITELIDTKTASTKKGKIEDVNKTGWPGQLDKKVDSTEASHWVQKSFELVNQGKYAESITAADKAISLDPGLANPYINRAWAYSETGQYDKAIGDCDIALAIMPDNAMAYNNRGLAYHRKGEMGYARRDYKKACELNLEVGCKNYEIVAGRI